MVAEDLLRATLCCGLISLWWSIQWVKVVAGTRTFRLSLLGQGRPMEMLRDRQIISGVWRKGQGDDLSVPPSQTDFVPLPLLEPQQIRSRHGSLKGLCSCGKIICDVGY